MADPKIQFYNNLSNLLNAGVPIQRAIQTAGRTTRGRCRRAAQYIEQGVREGKGIADCMTERKSIFPPLDIELVRVGEETGQLEEMLAELGRWHEFRQKNRNTVKTGLLLPVLILHAASGLVAIVDHPQFYVGGSELIGWFISMMRVLAIFYIPAAVICAIVFLTPKRGPLRRILDVFVMGIPLLGSAVRHLSLSRYCRTFSLSYGAGIPILRAAEQATNACGNWVMYNRLKGGVEKAKQGDNMSIGFSRALDAEFREVWIVGEESGDLDISAERLGKLYADRAEFRFKMIAEWLPRIVYFMVSAYIIYKIFSFYTRIYGGILGGL